VIWKNLSKSLIHRRVSLAKACQHLTGVKWLYMEDSEFETKFTNAHFTEDEEATT
jgi:hypothetical protein